MLLVLLFQFCFFICSVLSQVQKCYYPNGDLAANDVPCRNGTTSTCCGPGFACLNNGVCQVTVQAIHDNPSLGGSQIDYYRGSCTDNTWASSACPQFCIGTQYADNGGNSMFKCTDFAYCCYGGTCGCGGLNTTDFTVNDDPYTTIGVIPDATSTLASSSSSSSSTTTASSSTFTTSVSSVSSTGTPKTSSATVAGASSTPTTASNPTASTTPNGLSSGAKIGIGVGVSLGVVALAVIGYLIYRNMKQRRQLNAIRQPQMLQNPYERSELDSNRVSTAGYGSPQMPPKFMTPKALSRNYDPRELPG